MKWLSKNRRRIFMVLMSMIIFCGAVCSTTFDVHAVGTSNNLTFYVSYAEPAANDLNGYFSAVYENYKTGKYELITFFWTILPITSDGSSRCISEMEITLADTTIHFKPDISGAPLFDWSMARYSNKDLISISKFTDYQILANNAQFTFDYTVSNSTSGKLVGYTFGGNVTGVMNGNNYPNTPSIQWSNSVHASTLYNYLTQIINALGDLIGGGVSSDKQEEISQKQEEQKETIGALNDKNKVDKVDINSSSGSAEEYVDGQSITNYGTIISVFTNNSYILQCILFVLSTGLVAYVLFGKKK